jgi:subtilase family serine protease
MRAAAMTAFDEGFQSAAAMGITICVAAGDDGSSDGWMTGVIMWIFQPQAVLPGLWWDTGADLEWND